MRPGFYMRISYKEFPNLCIKSIHKSNEYILFRTINISYNIRLKYLTCKSFIFSVISYKWQWMSRINVFVRRGRNLNRVK